jgi:hypothetical protein
MDNKVEERIQHLAALGRALRTDAGLEEVIARAYAFNPWFAPAFTRAALAGIISQMLDEQKLRQWLSRYNIPDVLTPKKVGVIMAGNLPLVGFHDFLCVYVAGHIALVKLSGKDDVLFPYIFDKLAQIDTALTERAGMIERLEGFDAVIATGSNNSNRYFEYYFRNYPSILRRNRNSVAILTGSETEAELHGLADDIFMYFGFGCRNVSKLYVPGGYDITTLFPYFSRYKWMHSHTKYMNNYDYNRTLLLLNSTPHLANEFIMLQESTSISSPVSIVYYESYVSNDDLIRLMQARTGDVQCIVADAGMWPALDKPVGFGHTQKPELWDYADNVDIMEFLIS